MNKIFFLMGEIRVSAAGLVRIKIDEKYLLVLNKGALKIDKKVYTPFGGALEFYESSRVLLESLGAKFEKGTDLRFKIPEENLEGFEDWFYQRIGRETIPYRELREELVIEENVFLVFPENISLQYVKDARERSVLDRDGVNTQRYFEVYQAYFLEEHVRKIRATMERPGSHLGLFTEKEIKSRISDSGTEIGSNCLALL